MVRYPSTNKVIAMMITAMVGELPCLLGLPKTVKTSSAPKSDGPGDGRRIQRGPPSVTYSKILAKSLNILSMNICSKRFESMLQRDPARAVPSSG
jgi:hypothetical protein